MKKSVLLALSMLVPSVMMTTPASATLLRIDFAGSIASLTGPGGPDLGTVFSVGDGVSGNAIYDSAGAQISSAGTVATYDALQSISVTIAGSTFSATGGANFVWNDDVTFDDALSVDGTTGVSGPTVAGATANRVKLHLRTPVLSTLTSLALPGLSELSALAANNAGDGNINFVAFSTAGGSGVARYDLADIRVSSVGATALPLPATLVLVVGGLGLIAGLSSARRRGSTLGR